MANNLLDSLFAYWRCEEASGTRFDSHGPYDILQVAGTVLNVAGKDGNACSFATDIANRLARTDDGAFDFTGSFSVNGWQDIPATNNAPIIGKFDSSGAPDVNDSWLLWHRTTNNKMRFSVSSDGTSEETIVEPALTTPTGQYNMVSAGFDADNNEIWIKLNGGTRVKVAHAGGIFAAAVDLTMGWFEGSSKVMGDSDVDEVPIWTRFLTTVDVADLWNGGAGLFLSSFESSSTAASISIPYYYS